MVKETLALLLGAAAYIYGGWIVWASRIESDWIAAFGFACFLLGIVGIIYGVNGLTNWSLKF